MPDLIRVNTDQMIAASTQLSSLADDFFSEYNELYTLIEGDLAACWTGEDFNAFKTKTSEEKHFFETMRDIVTEYATFLYNTAVAHQGREEDSRAQATQQCIM